MDDSDAERFVDAFRDAWAEPDIDRLTALLHDDVRLVQPISPPAVGREAAHRNLQGVLDAMPDIRGEVHRWSARDEAIFIEFSFTATIGRRPFRWDLVDRFALKDRLAIERVSYFDPVPLIIAVLTRPSSWRRWWRAKLLPFQ